MKTLKDKLENFVNSSYFGLIFSIFLISGVWINSILLKSITTIFIFGIINSAFRRVSCP